MLKDLRIRAHLTQRELADRVGLKKTTICMYEKGERTPTLKTLQKLAHALLVSDEEILRCFKESRK